MTRPNVVPRSASWASLLGGIGALLLPKCALCAAAYGSALGALGLAPAVNQRLMESLIVLTVVTSFGLVLVLGTRRGDVVTPMVSAVGAALVLAGRYALEQPIVTGVGAAVLVGAALYNTARCRKAKLAPVVEDAESGGAVAP